MSDDLKLSMSIDGDKLIKAINGIYDMISTLVQKVQTPITLNVDMSNFTDVINASVENVKTTAIDGVSQVETAIQSSADQISASVKENTNGMLTDLSKLGLSINAVTGAFKKVISVINTVVQVSNAQEVSLQNLSSALRLNGELTSANITKYQSYANEVQRATNVSNAQVYSLLSLATSYGVVESKRKQTVDGAIALSKVYGISLDAALRGVTLGMEGNFEQLQRQIPALKLAGTEAEKMAQFQKQLADGLQIAKDETKTSAGAMIQLKNEVSGLNALFGDVIKDTLSPYVKLLSQITNLLNRHPAILKTIITAVGAYVVAITTANIVNNKNALITALKTSLLKKYGLSVVIATGATKAFNAALKANPIIMIASLILIGVSAFITLIGVFRKGKKATDDFNESLEDMPTKNEIRFEIKYGDEWTQLRDNLKSRTTTLDEHYQKEMAINEAHYKSNLSQMEIAKRDEKNALSQKYLEQYAEMKKKYKKDEVLLQQHLAEAYRIHKEGLAKINADFLAQTAKLQEEVADMTRQLDSKLQEDKKAQHAEQISKELARQKDIYDIAKQRFDLELTSYDDMKKAMDEYYHWVSARYNKHSKEYLDAYSILHNEKKAINQKREQETKENEARLTEISNAEWEIRQARLAMNDPAKALYEQQIKNVTEFYAKKFDLFKDDEQRTIELENQKKDALVQIDQDYYRQKFEALQQADMEQKQAQSEFERKKFEASQEFLSVTDPYQAQRDAFANFLKEKSDLLKQAGYDDLQIQNYTEKAKLDFLLQTKELQLNAIGDLYGQWANIAAGFGKKGFKISQALQLAQVTMETPAAAMAAFRAVVGIPVIGPGLAPVAAATALATGAMRFKQIAETKPPEYAQGGLLKGASHSAGGIIIEAEGDEYITNKKRVGELGTKFFDFINFAPLEKVRETFSGISLPPIMQTPIPTPVMSMGGSVTQLSSKSTNMQDMFIDLKSELVDSLKELKTTFENKKMEVHNHISANEVIKKADPTLIHNANHKGELIISAI